MQAALQDRNCAIELRDGGRDSSEPAGFGSGPLFAAAQPTERRAGCRQPPGAAGAHWAVTQALVGERPGAWASGSLPLVLQGAGVFNKAATSLCCATGQQWVRLARRQCGGADDRAPPCKQRSALTLLLLLPRLAGSHGVCGAAPAGNPPVQALAEEYAQLGGAA